MVDVNGWHPKVVNSRLRNELRSHSDLGCLFSAGDQSRRVRNVLDETADRLTWALLRVSPVCSVASLCIPLSSSSVEATKIRLALILLRRDWRSQFQGPVSLKPRMYPVGQSSRETKVHQETFAAPHQAR